MPAVTRCRCCDLPVESCGKAAEERIRAEEHARLVRLLRTPPWLPAKFAGTCAICSESFPAGYPIRAHLERKWVGRRWVGACCAEQ